MTLPGKLGKYEIRRELGRGAMGIVYEGWDASIGRRVAVKTVKRDQLEQEQAEEVLARFRHEAQAAGRLSHPNIVSVFEFGEDAGVSFIAMEFIEGRELKGYFDKDERFQLPEIVRIMTQLLDALDAAHRNGVVHRDIKPSNIFLLGDGTVKVADFGIAHIESSNLTQAGSVLGTPAYMSPEQFSGQSVDGRSDLFSAGIILYQFLTGEKPFTGAFTTIMHKVLKEEPPAPSELNVHTPRAFDAVVRKAIAKRPDERFQSGREFHEALRVAVTRAVTTDTDNDRTLATDDGVRAATVLSPNFGAQSSSAPVAAAPAAKAAPTGTPPVRNRTLLAIAGIVGLAVSGAGVMVFLNKGKPPEAISVQDAAPVGTVPQAAVSAESATYVITAEGLADPGDPRYQQDKGLMATDLREDLKRQLVEKAAALYIDRASLIQNYVVLQAKLLARSGEFIQSVQEDHGPRLGNNGLMSVTAHATVNVRDVQKSLNKMSQEERIDFIRNNGDPKISVGITIKSAAGDSSGPAQPSPVAENLLKERVQSFGFRIWNDDAATANKTTGADFAVTGEAKFKKLTAKLEASGLTIEKFVLTSWTVKCTDKKTGEEIYHNTQIPENASWATEDLALRDIGKLVGEEFSRNFFLQHFHFTGQKVTLNVPGLPDAQMAQNLLNEFIGIRSVLAARLEPSSGGAWRYALEISGGAGSTAELVQNGLLGPLNRKLGRSCFSISGSSTAEINLALDAACSNSTVLGRLDNLPPAGLFDAPQLRREAVSKNPEILRKLSI